MKLKMLFCGFRHSHVYEMYKRAADHERICIAGCIEPDEEARAAATKALGVDFSEKSYEAWLSEDIDVVAIGTVYGDRGRHILAALKAGKHVICDKPVCTDLEELAEISRLASEQGRSVVCMLDLRYLPQTLAAKEILQSGALGEVRNVSFNGQHCLSYGSRPRWYYEPGLHGGTINDLAIHGVDLVRLLTGMEFSAVDGARVWNSYATEQRDFKDSAVFMARLENGASVLADVSYSAPGQVFTMPTYWEFRFWCEKGMLTFCYTDSQVTVYRDGEAGPVRVCGIPTQEDWMTDLISRIDCGDRGFTENTLRSCKTALEIQAVADGGK